MRTANLHRSHPLGAAAPTFRPLMDLAHILEAAQASKHYYADRFCYAAKVPIVLFCCLDLFKEVG